MAVRAVPLNPSRKNPTVPKLNQNADEPFWRTKRLQDLSESEWESLCDGCGRCCLEKLEDLDTGEISYTDVSCTLLDTETCRCSNYDDRLRFVPDCVPLDHNNVAELKWMPPTCAYRLLAEGGDLPSWHPLVSNNPDSVLRAGVAVKGRVTPADEAEDLEDHIVTWPAKWPEAAR